MSEKRPGLPLSLLLSVFIVLAARLSGAQELVGPPWGYEFKAAQVEGHYQAYTQKLARIYDTLLERTRRYAPRSTPS